MTTDISVILNGYKRPHLLSEQINAVNNQSIKPTNILYWQNSQNGVEYNIAASNQCISAITNTNFGVWARFSYALNVRTNWVCIFDDDTIPGSQWFENCLLAYQTHPGLLGTIGVIFPDNGIYHNVYRVGWDNPNEEITTVDIVGHSWFFHRDMLSYFWRELPPLNHNYAVGEDIHFSYMLQKYTKYGTYVPPHPKAHPERWGSLKGWQYGADTNATASLSDSMQGMNQYLQYAVKNGFRLQCDKGVA